MISALKSVGRNSFVLLVSRLPFLGGILGFFLACLPFSDLAARLYVWLAGAMIKAGNDDAAIRYCDLALARCPTLSSAYFHRGQRYFSKRDWVRAAEDLQRGIACLTPAAKDQLPLPPDVCEPLAHCHERLGLLLSSSKPAEAIEHYNAALELLPSRYTLHIHRGESYHYLGAVEQAFLDFLTPLASGLAGYEAADCLLALGRLLATVGRVEQAIAFYYAGSVLRYHFNRERCVHWRLSYWPSWQQLDLAQLLWPEDSQAHELLTALRLQLDKALQAKTGVLLDPSVEQPLDVVRLVQAHDLLGEDLMNMHGDARAAQCVYRYKLDLQQRLATSCPLADPDTLVLPADWVRQIGHMGFIDTWIKMKQLGWRSWKRIVLLAPRDRTANRHYLGYWSDWITVVTDPHTCEMLAPVATAFAFRVASALFVPGSELLYFFEAPGLVQKEWEAQGRQPLLTLTNTDEERGWQALNELGVPRDAWFVCIHVRESGFHKGGDTKHQAHRDANILDYQRAMRLITDRGGWVMRMGDPTMTELPEMEHVIDYAHSPAKSESMDVFLSGRCRLFIGLASGLSQVAVSFGVPCVYVNWISNVLPPFSTRDVYIPKLVRSERDGRLMSFSELYDRSNLELNCNNHLLHLHGLNAIDNEATDIHDAVLEMLEQLDGCWSCSDEDRRLQDRLNVILREKGHAAYYCRMGKAFLRRHGHLLGESSIAQPAAA